MFELLNAIVWIFGLGCFASCILLIVCQKNKRSDDWKLIIGAGVFGIIWLLYVLNQLFG